MELDGDEPPALVDVSEQQETDARVDGQDHIASQVQDMTLNKVPLTLITEFGDSTDIERALTVTQNGQEVQEWLELGNGCICCSIKDSGVNAIESLMDRRGTFDYIILETSGLADPGNLAPLFWVDEGLGSSIYLDGIVCLVDAGNILRNLDEHKPEDQHDVPAPGASEGEIHQASHHETTAHLQISHADVIVLNKCDTIPPAQLTLVEERIRSINGLANLHRTSYSQVPRLETFLLDLHAYDGVEALDTVGKGHSHLDPTISTLALPIPRLHSPTGIQKLESWLRSVLWDSTLPLPLPSPPQTASSTSIEPPPYPNSRPPDPFSIHRTKGRIITNEGKVKMIQGVREVFEIVDIEGSVGGNANDGGGRVQERKDLGSGKLVLIGRGLDESVFGENLALCLGN